MSSVDEQIDEISQKILATIEQTSLKELSAPGEVTEILHLTDVHRAKKLIEHMDKASTQSERNVGKTAVIKALLLSTWLQRLYFVIRSFTMGLLSALLTFTVILIFGSINFGGEIALGVFSFTFSLVVSRLLDKQIVGMTKNIITFLGKHKRARDLIINHL